LAKDLDLFRNEASRSMLFFLRGNDLILRLEWLLFLVWDISNLNTESLLETMMASSRPRGDITTVIDLASRDAQDDYFFPLDTDKSWFHREPSTTYPMTMTSQEFAHRGTADWGGRLTFELNALTAGDLLQALVLQIRLGSWYDPATILKMSTQDYTIDVSDASNVPWTYINSLGTSIIEYAEFEVGDQTLERLDGAFIKLYSSLIPDENMLIGLTADANGITSLNNVANNTGSMNPQRPWPTQNGVYYCLLPFFFLRTRFKEVFPLLSCKEGSVRVNVQLRPFSDCVRTIAKARQSCTDTPLGSSVIFKVDTVPEYIQKGKYRIPVAQLDIVKYTAPLAIPAIQDFRVLTYCALVDSSVRDAYIHRPFEQLTKFVTNFYFDEPYKYLASKTNSDSDTIELSLPLELNHPTQEIVWVFRRKGVAINNEWGNFSPVLETQYNIDSVHQPWLVYATLRINGFIVEQAEGEWWRRHIASSHKGGWNAWASYAYGYSFAMDPDAHQPSGSANMSRSTSIRLDLQVRVPTAVPVPSGFDANVSQGWEIHVYAVHLNWLRFQNGLCQKLYED